MDGQTDVNDNSCDAQHSVVEFFNGKSVLVTGATGFMGKVLVFKLLRSCPGIQNLYVLIRDKNDSTAQQRLKALMKNEIYKELTDEHIAKVVAIQGDVTLPNLGIDDKDEVTLRENVSVIFHSAATVKFDDLLSNAVQINLEGTIKMVELARKLKHLQAFVHVSTAYTHCYESHMEERPCPVKGLSWKAVQQICHLSSNISLVNDEGVTKKIVGAHPNTYSFTKALTDDMLYENFKDLPIAILRPSIVIGAWKEPFPGFVDNLNGPTGMSLGAATGIMRSILVKENNIADVVPVDMVVNLMCLIASRLPEDFKKKPIEQRFYNYASGLVNPITWKQIRDLARLEVIRSPFYNTVWYPSLAYQTNRWVDAVNRAFKHTLLAIFVDLCCTVSGKKPFLLKIVQKMHKASDTLEYFSTRQWTWDCSNSFSLSKELNKSEKDEFETDLSKIDWPEFKAKYIRGIGRFILKEDPSTFLISPSLRLQLLHVLNLLVVFIVICVLLTILSYFDPFDILDDKRSIASFGLVFVIADIIQGL